MIECSFFYDELVNFGIDFFVGIPDSVLKSFCAYVGDRAGPENHIIAANEGGAIAMACGHYLATGKAGLVYMQNSGQGNAVNPLVSLAEPEVYSVPVLILIGWRGEPGKEDEPQHIKQGKITLSLLDALGVPYKILPDNPAEVPACLQEIIGISMKNNRPVALIVKKGTFRPYQIQKCVGPQSELSRETAIKTVVRNLDASDIIVSTTGKISRELYEYRDRLDGNHSKDFLTVGSMGHCSQIAMGIALSKPGRQIYCFDGDGAVIMHMGALAIAGSSKVKNFKHIVFNNGCHDSVGGQPTCGFAVSITGIANACGYVLALQAGSVSEINDQMKVIKSAQGPAMLEIKVAKGARKDLGRPKSSPRKYKREFMEFLRR